MNNKDLLDEYALKLIRKVKGASWRGSDVTELLQEYTDAINYQELKMDRQEGQERPLKAPKPNQCLECKFREEIKGSSLSKCTHPIPNKDMWGLAEAVTHGLKVFPSKDGEFNLLEFHNQELYPVHFDPQFVTCRLPVLI